MTPSEFRDRLRTHGPALERWLDAEQARHLLAISPRARRRFLAALKHDRSLDEPIDPAILARLAARMRVDIAQAPRSARPKPSFAVPLQWGALAACALLGIWAGSPGTPAVALPGPAVLASMQITALDPPWPETGR